MNQNDILAVQNAEKTAQDAEQAAQKQAGALLAEGKKQAAIFCEKALANEAENLSRRLEEVANESQEKLRQAIEDAGQESEQLRLLAKENAQNTIEKLIAQIV